MAKETMKVVKVLQAFFGRIKMDELKELSKSERFELAVLAAEELDVILDTPSV